MANIAAKVASIRQAVYGKDVRESIASGIEAINTEVVSTTGRQNVIDQNEAGRVSAETTRVTAENLRLSQEEYRQNTFDAMEHTEPIFEIVEARDGEVDLKTRLDINDTKVELHSTQLSDKVNYTDFTKSLGSTGWRRLPDGVIEQWGTQVIQSNTTTSITFPIAFTITCYNPIVSCNYVASITVTTNGATKIDVWSNATTQIWWRAIGK